MGGGSKTGIERGIHLKNCPWIDMWGSDIHMPEP